MFEFVDQLEKFDVQADLPACGVWRDHMPKSRDIGAYRLYIKARKNWRSKREWQHTMEENRKILQDVSAAADMGDWGAKALMSYYYLNGLGMFDSNYALRPQPAKAVELMRQAAVAGQAWGYYDLGVAFERGYGGLQGNRDKVWRLFLKAAKLGSPEAQMALATAYQEADRLDESDVMRRCAYVQNHGEAAYELGLKSMVFSKHALSIKYLHDGARFGHAGSASALSTIFSSGNILQGKEEDELAMQALGYFKDEDRSMRYWEITKAIKANPDLKFPQLDAVLPLPPGKLGKWHGIEDAIGPEPDGAPSY